MNTMPLEHALKLDEIDVLRGYRDSFHIPKAPDGSDCIYLCGNSLGLQPKRAREYINQELDDWARLGVEGHFHAKHPWLPYHEFLTEQTARLVGALPIEVVVMNTLTTNLHLMMVSFYRPTKERFKILVEGGAFPSDQYAVASQAKFHGFDPAQAIVQLTPRDGEATLREEDILSTIEKQGHEIALVLLGNVNYLTGQSFDIEEITRAAHKKGCRVGFDLAHGAGNLHLKLHDWGPDFAVWCSYKYLNSGPGALSGCFVHERHARERSLPRFAGWWGHDKASRFKMGPNFEPIPGAEGWQLSNPPIFQLAALRASMEIFDQAGMATIRTKGNQMVQYLRSKLAETPGAFQVITPVDQKLPGSQLSIRIRGNAREVVQKLLQNGVVTDFREPDVVRVAPVALYNTFSDVHRFADQLRKHVS